MSATVAWLLKPLLILAAVLAVVILYHLIDRVSLSEQRSPVTVREKFFREAHSTTSYSRVGNSMRPVITQHPDEWVLKVEKDGVIVEAMVPEAVWKEVGPSDKVTLIYTQRRITRAIYVSGIEEAAK